MKVGIQLYSVRNNMAKDPLKTIQKVVNSGYRYLEIANHSAETDPGVGFGVSAKEILKVLNECNGQIIGGHIFPLIAEKMDAVLEYHSQIGTKFLAMPMDFYTDYDDVLRKSEVLDKVGEKCRKAGIEFVYHNHFHEFQIFKGKTIYDTIMENTDPKNLKIELDSYWVIRGGQSVTEILKKYGKRVRLLHQKDFPKKYENQLDLIKTVRENNPVIDMKYFESVVSPSTFTEIGTGIIDIQEIINTAKEHCNVEYIILEQDYTTHEEIESIEISMKSFRKFSGIEW